MPAVIARLQRAKLDHRVSVCIPARNEEATVAAIVRTITSTLIEDLRLVDEVVVVDDGSMDSTAEVARRAGATVARAADVLVGEGPGTGKGEALWKSVHLATGDLIVFCDADLRSFDPRFVTRLLEPLLMEPGVGFVKGYYARSCDGVEGEGGRVTALAARPILSLLFGELRGVLQPLAGEYAARREVLEVLPFVEGYGVDLGLLIDVWRRFGIGAIAQVDLGTRVHRNRTLDQLAPQARAVLATALDRAGVSGETGPVTAVAQRPPLVSVAAYREARTVATTSATQLATSAMARSRPKRSTSETNSTSGGSGGSPSSSTSPATTTTGTPA